MEMETFKLVLFSVWEVRWNSAGSITTRCGNLFIYSGMPGGNEPHIRGVRILRNKKKYAAVSERNITARINTQFRKMLLLRMHI
jgi:hypothetical protein